MGKDQGRIIGKPVLTASRMPRRKILRLWRGIFCVEYAETSIKSALRLAF